VLYVNFISEKYDTNIKIP